jgi:catechol 2,3-dioxygenase-like lactoylglutathione lyase family enzyme
MLSSMITRTQFVLAVPDLEKSSTFYRNVLGFAIYDLAPGWLRYERDGCSILAGECRDALPPRELGDHSYFAYFVVDDLDAMYDRLVAASAEILKPPRAEAWGMRELALRTADGHRIMLGQPV